MYFFLNRIRNSTNIDIISLQQESREQTSKARKENPLIFLFYHVCFVKYCQQQKKKAPQTLLYLFTFPEITQHLSRRREMNGRTYIESGWEGH